uniref:(northern house mosquito) hypothetical protein n=1 Tax=Culex pipiens TaxID=7175 RepID=A0A8D8ATE8_CULPI
MAMVTKALAQLVEIRDMVLTVREVTLERALDRTREVRALKVQVLEQIRVKEVREVTAIKEPATKEVPALMDKVPDLSRVLVDLTVVVLRFLEELVQRDQLVPQLSRTLQQSLSTLLFRKGELNKKRIKLKKSRTSITRVMDAVTRNITIKSIPKIIKLIQLAVMVSSVY